MEDCKPVQLIDDPILMTLRTNDVPPALECRGLSKAYGAGRVLLASLEPMPGGLGLPGGRERGGGRQTLRDRTRERPIR